MSLIRAEEKIRQALLLEDIRRKANKTKNLRATAGRVSRGATEVMVKITGFGKGGGHIKAHLDYNSRNGKVELENDRGEVFSSQEAIKEVVKEWGSEFSDHKRRENQRDTMHMVLSMPEGVEPESVKNAVRDFAKDVFGKNHEYVFALHTDELHPHVHLTVKMLGHDGTRLNPRKGELRQWRDDFALAMRDQGIDAEATPRASRGIVKKPESQVIRHIERGDKTHKPRKSKVKALKELEVIEEIKAEINGKPPVERVWDKMILKQQRTIRGAWLGAANELKETPDPSDKNLSGDIQSFVAAMPKIDTERHEIKARLIERFSKQREISQQNVNEEPKQPAIDQNQATPKSKDIER